MPEGDTIHKVAGVVSKELDDTPLKSCLIRGVYGSERLAGSRVTKVEAVGKHMLLHFDRDLLLRVHLGMKGSWHRYPPGARWKRSRSQAAVVLETDKTVLVCFNALDIEVIPAPQRKWHRQLSNLGPDLLGEEEPDWDKVWSRAARLHKAGDFLGEVLLDQRVAAGIGNVYKSELAFMGGLEGDAFRPGARGYCPWTPLAEVEREDLLGMFRRARLLLQANLGGWWRTTTVDRRKLPAPSKGTLFVYGRADDPCLRCGEPVAVDFQGLQNRVTYWCPVCQGDRRPEATKKKSS